MIGARHDVRRATRADARALATTLARAFHDDPVMSWFFPDPKRRLAQNRRFFAMRLRQLLSQEETYTVDGHGGTAIWAIPEGTHLTLLQTARMGVVLAPAIGRRVGTILRGVEQIEKAHPKDPHYYLAVLGTEPELQGQGLGSALMQPVLDAMRPRRGARLPGVLEGAQHRLLRAARLPRDRRAAPAQRAAGVVHVARPPALRRCRAYEVREVAGAGQRLRDRGGARAAVRAHARARPRHLRAPHRRRVRRRAAALGPRRARVRGAAADLQPGRLGGRAVRQRRARGHPLPAPPRLDRHRHVLDPDRGRRGAPAHHRAHHLHRGHGARPASGRRTSRRAATTAPARSPRPGRELRFQHVSIGNPQCAIEVGDELEQLDLAELGPPIERQRAVPQPHQRLVLAPRLATTRSPRASSSAGWGRPCRPAPARAARRWPPCCAGLDSPGDRAPRRRRARGGRGRGPARRPDRLGRARLPRASSATNSWRR